MKKTVRLPSGRRTAGHRLTCMSRGRPRELPLCHDASRLEGEASDVGPCQARCDDRAQTTLHLNPESGRYQRASRLCRTTAGKWRDNSRETLVPGEHGLLPTLAPGMGRNGKKSLG